MKIKLIDSTPQERGRVIDITPENTPNRKRTILPEGRAGDRLYLMGLLFLPGLIMSFSFTPKIIIAYLVIWGLGFLVMKIWN